MFPHPLCHFSGNGANASSVENVIASACFHLDMTVPDSHKGSELDLKNIVSVPADGSATTDFDAHFGVDDSVSSDDPTPTGTGEDRFAALDGSKLFTMKTNTAGMLQKIHRSDFDWWISFLWQPLANHTLNRRAWGSRQLGTDRGTDLQTPVDDLYDVIASNGTSGVFLSNGDVAIPGATPSMVTVSVQGAGSSNNIRIWSQSDTATVLSQALNASTVDSANIFGICAGKGGVTPLENGSRFYAICGGNEFLTNTKHAAIRAHFKSIHPSARYGA